MWPAQLYILEYVILAIFSIRERDHRSPLNICCSLPVPAKLSSVAQWISPRFRPSTIVSLHVLHPYKSTVETALINNPRFTDDGVCLSMDLYWNLSWGLSTMLFLFSSIPHPRRCLFICIACPKWIQPSRSWTFLVFEFRVKQWHYRFFIRYGFWAPFFSITVEFIE